MPDLSQALNAKLAAEKEEQAKSDASDKSIRDAKDAEAFGKIDRLAQNPDWLWFRETYLKRYIDGDESESAKALDIRKTPEVRNNHAQRNDIAYEIIGRLDQERIWLINRLNRK